MNGGKIVGRFRPCIVGGGGGGSHLKRLDRCALASRSTSSRSLWANASDTAARFGGLLLSPWRPCPCPCASASASAFSATAWAVFRAGTSANNGDCRGFVELQGLAVLSAAPSRTPGMLTSSTTSKAASSSSEMAGLPILLLAQRVGKLMPDQPKKTAKAAAGGGRRAPKRDPRSPPGPRPPGVCFHPVLWQVSPGPAPPAPGPRSSPAPSPFLSPSSRF